MSTKPPFSTSLSWMRDEMSYVYVMLSLPIKNIEFDRQNPISRISISARDFDWLFNSRCDTKQPGQFKNELIQDFPLDHNTLIQQWSVIYIYHRFVPKALHSKANGYKSWRKCLPQKWALEDLPWWLPACLASSTVVPNGVKWGKQKRKKHIKLERKKSLSTMLWAEMKMLL